MGSIPWVGRILWKRKWQSTPVFLPGESHGQRSLTGYSPWGCKESDMTERLTTTTSPLTVSFFLYYVQIQVPHLKQLNLCQLRVQSCTLRTHDVMQIHRCSSQKRFLSHCHHLSLVAQWTMKVMIILTLLLMKTSRTITHKFLWELVIQLLHMTMNIHKQGRQGKFTFTS